MFTFFAVAKHGAIAVPVNFRLTATEVQYILERSDAAILVCDKEFEKNIAEASKGTNVRLVVTFGKLDTVGYFSYDGILSKNTNEPDFEVFEQDDLEKLYTSGTTGRPKGALFDHDQIFKVGISVIVNMEIRQHERILHLAPLFHSAELNLFLIPGVALAATHIIHRDFHPVKTLQAIQEHKITHLFAVPAM